MTKKLLSLLLVLALVLGMLPGSVFAVPDLGQVRVIVENGTWLKDDSATWQSGEEPDWDGILVDEWVDLAEDSSVATCLVAALERNDYTQKGAANGYVSQINGIGEFDNGWMSGWMFTLNDWFANAGCTSFTVANGKLIAGDEIHFMYTSNGYGEDLGGTWGNSDTTVKAVEFSKGTLNTAFDKDTYAYTLTVPADVTSLTVRATASNKNYMVRTKSSGDTGTVWYRANDAIAIADGTVLSVVCADSSFGSMNGSGATKTYTFTVQVEKTGNVWDGTTRTEPEKDSEGVYQIGTGAELAWFVYEHENNTPNKTTISGVLTADIDLGGKAWVSAVVSGKGQTLYFDGQNHKVTGLNSERGLFAVVSNVSSVVKNVSVYGEVDGSNLASSSASKVAGIAAYFNGTMENCVNYANVKGQKWVGGLMGYTANKNTKILNCANFGNITATGECAAGIAGYIYAGGTITGCGNFGNVTGTTYVGGIGGKQTQRMDVTGCCNTGNISGTQYVGGLFGYATASNGKNPTLISDCYSSGTVTGTSDTNALLGKAVKADKPFVSAERLYFLSSVGKDSYGTAQTEQQLKAMTNLDTTYFQSVCGDYPALAWQTGLKAHTSSAAGTVTAPGCESKGYTTYTCTACGVEYRSDWTTAVGHKYCDHAVNVTCVHCEYDPAATTEAEGTLKRHCQNAGCQSVKEEEVPRKGESFEVTLPENMVGYTIQLSGDSQTTVVAGDSFSFTLTISGEYKKGETFAVKANGVDVPVEGGVYTISNIQANQTITVEGVVAKTNADKGVTIIAPAGSTISVGQFSNYYIYNFCEPLEGPTDLGDGRISMVFPTTKIQGFYRVQHPDGVTYWAFTENSGLTAGSVYEVTGEMLHIGDEDFTKDTVYANFEKNGYDKADIYLNVNEKGYLALDTDDTYELNVFRNWIALGNSTMNTSVALPDVTYTVISVDGTASDVVTVTPNANNSCVANVTANHAGTAIILVTYDAMTNANGLGGQQFSAIWPENTGVIVVSVDADGSAITTNMTVNETANGTKKQTLDAEHDILFYVGTAGAQYSFQPEAGCTVSVARSTVNGTMNFSGFTTEQVELDADGVVTVKGLTTGAHIIRVEKDGLATYQVIRARQVSYTLTDESGNAITKENPAQPGQKVYVQFAGLISPMEKLSGIYNSNFGFYYNGQDGAQIRVVGGYYGVYDFSGNSARQRFAVTIPEVWNAKTYVLTDGAIKCGGFGSFAGAHRGVTYASGKAPNTNADTIDGLLSVLPDIRIPVAFDGEAVEVTPPTGKGFTFNGMVTAAIGQDYTFTLSVNGGYDGSAMVVKANGVTLTAGENDTYVVENVTEDLTITVEGLTKLSQTFTGEGTKLYDYDFHEPESVADTDYGWITDGINYFNVKDFTLFGAEVETIVWNEDKSLCQVQLSAGTATNAVLGFAITYGVGGAMKDMEEALIPAFFASLNGSDMTAGEAMAVRMVNGKAVVQVNAGIDLTSMGDSKYTYPKTFVITIAPEKFPVNLPSGEGYTITPADGSASPVTAGGSYSFSLTIGDGYEMDGSKFAVKANGVTLTAVDGLYTIENIQEVQNVTVEGILTPDEVAARQVEAQIAAIGEITLTEACQNALIAARNAYGALTPAQQALVSNLDVLTAGEAKLAQLKQEAIRNAYKTTGDYIAALGTPGVGSIGGEWMAIGLLRSDRTVDEAYYKAVVAYVQANIDENGRLHRAKSTENSRIILALTAMGKDVTNVGGYNLLRGLSDLTFLQKQGINGPIWALIALDSGDYTLSEGDVTREALIDLILNAQLADGGWALSGDTADSDMTGMALQALAPYYGKMDAVTEAVDAALETLATLQYASGGFGTYGSETSESAAQVIVALTALGIDPTTDSRFIRNGNSVLDALLAYYVDGGGFRHIATGNRDGMATEQGYYALTAYARLLAGKTSLYDMSDVTIVPEEPENPDVPSVPTEPDVPTAPVEPEEPDVPDVPTEPNVPTVPADPEEPEQPDVPDVPTEPVEPEQPTTPSAPEKPSSPKTGDEAMTMWFVLMAVCAAGVVLLLAGKKKMTR